MGQDDGPASPAVSGCAGVGPLREDTGALGRQRDPLDAVEDGQRGVRGEARQQHRGRVLAPPRRAARPGRPSRARPRSAASTGFEPVTMSRSGGCRRTGRPAGSPRRCAAAARSPRGHALHRVAAHLDHLCTRRRVQQVEELAFGRVEGAVGHVVDERARPAGRTGAASVDRCRSRRPRCSAQPPLVPHVGVGDRHLLVQQAVDRLAAPRSPAADPTTAMMWFRDPSRQSRSAPGPWCTLIVSTPGWSLTMSMPVDGGDGRRDGRRLEEEAVADASGGHRSVDPICFPERQPQGQARGAPRRPPDRASRARRRRRAR